jgi:hypothetical protein
MASQTATSSSHKFGGAGVGGGEPFGRGNCATAACIWSSAHFKLIAVGAFEQRGVGGGQDRIARIIAQGEAHSISRRGSDQRRAADGHVADRLGAIVHRAQGQRLEFVRQKTLIDHADGTGASSSLRQIVRQRLPW